MNEPTNMRQITPLVAPAPLLADPGALDELAQSAVDALLAAGESAHTVASYRSALTYWAAWFALRYGTRLELPLPEAAVLQFIVDHAERVVDGQLVTELPAALDARLVAHRYKARLGAPALATLRHRLAVLSAAHREARVANPLEAPAVKTLLQRTRRAYAQRGVRSRAKAALTRDPLEQLLATCDASLAGLRDRALLLFAWASGGRRRSEVVRATCENVERVGAEAYLYALLHDKTHQSGAEHADAMKPVVGRAAAALGAWLAASGITAGAIFRRIRGASVGEPLSAAAVRDIVRKRATLAGLPPEQFSAHSLRSGFVTEAARQGVPLAETMSLTGHRSVATVLGYYRPGEVQTSRAARLLDEEAPKRLAPASPRGPADQ